MAYLFRVTTTFALLYGLLAATIWTTLGGSDTALVAAVGIAILTVCLQYALGPWLIRAIFDIDWQASLPARNHDFLRDLCEKHRIAMPAIGVIHGPMPNAFTFGHTPSSASIVVTQGLLDALTPEEANAVIAHEVGHIKHWDFLTMMIASIVPLLLYHLYSIANRIRRNHWAAATAFLAYLASQFIVLSLSRTREYWADNFAATSTGDASLLSSALVKICYGMAKLVSEDKWISAHGTKDQKKLAGSHAQLANKIGVLGISSPQASLILTGGSPSEAATLMRWDLENPWARVYQSISTHPLTALRVQELNREAERQGNEITVALPENTRVQWNGFFAQFILWSAPFFFGLSLLAFNYWRDLQIWPPDHRVVDLFAVMLLVSWLARIGFRYAGTFRPATIRELIADISASQMHPRAVSLEGEIVGRGSPEAFWSPDLVIQDSTGFLFVRDRQSIPLGRLWASAKADSWTAKKVVLHGWYRRGMMPYIELSCIADCDSDMTHRSYSRWVQVTAAFLVTGTLYWFAHAQARF